MIVVTSIVICFVVAIVEETVVDVGFASLGVGTAIYTELFTPSRECTLELLAESVGQCDNTTA